MLFCQYPHCFRLRSSAKTPFCSDYHREKAPMRGIPALIELCEGNEQAGYSVLYLSIKDIFHNQWLHSDDSPVIQHIYIINVAEELKLAYRAYQEHVEQIHGYEGNWLEPGNQHKYFHGTKRACRLGDGGSTVMCKKRTCSLCGIIRQSFKLDRCGSNKPWGSKATGRFGRGIYTSGTSSKAHDYTQNLCVSSLSAMLLNEVIVGKGKELRRSQPKLTNPPMNFDSVIGIPGKDSVLNYDECVVYDEHAIIPAYLIIYESPK